MFLSKPKIIISNIISFLLIIFSGQSIFIASFGIFQVVFDASSHPGTDLSVGIPTLLLSLAVFMLALKIQINIRRAYKFNRIFENASNGEIIVKDTAMLLGISPDKFMKRFIHLTGAGYLINCCVSNTENPSITLNNGSPNQFDVINCPACGAANKIRVGFEKKCEYCGSLLKKDQK